MCPNETPTPERRTIRLAALHGSLTVTPTSTVTVNDAKGSLVGWRAIVSLQTVPGLDAAR